MVQLCLKLAFVSASSCHIQYKKYRHKETNNKILSSRCHVLVFS
uniref:Uncharacterized protein n=1 Tax=Arundo donax TaxID=35708 RepID=A0A0A9A542_ARUDO